MEIKTIIEDRAAIVRFLENETGEKMDYAGAPTFNYRIGPYTVLRNGNIRVSDETADPALLQKLIEAGYAVDEAKRSAIEAEMRMPCSPSSQCSLPSRHSMPKVSKPLSLRTFEVE